MTNSRNQIVTSLVAVIGTEVFSSFYDDLLYPIAITRFGPLYGGVGVSIGAIVLNFLLVIWYRRTATDWYSFESAREMEAQELIIRASPKIRRSRIITFIFLAVQDPFLAFAYLQGRKGIVTLDKGDWFIFMLANAIGIGAWVFILLVLFATGGLISEQVGNLVMYGIGLYGLVRIFHGVYKHRVKV